MTNPKGAWFERFMADYFSHELGDADVDRQVKTGRNDKGDIRGIRIHGQKVVVEAKNTVRYGDISEALKEAEVERGNADALAAVVVAKRKGKGKPADQMVYMTARDFMALISGTRPEG